MWDKQAKDMFINGYFKKNNDRSESKSILTDVAFLEKTGGN